MPTNNFKIFDENAANLMDDVTYDSYAQRLNGVQTGVANSELHNKTLFQVSKMVYALSQLMNANGKDATDSIAISTFVNNLSASLLQKVADKANSSDVTTGTNNTKWVSPADVKSAIGNFGADALVFTNQLVPVASFVSNTTYADYPFRASVTLSGVTADMVPLVVFSYNDSVNSKLCNIATTYAGGIYIYAKEKPTSPVVIDTVICIGASK